MAGTQLLKPLLFLICAHGYTCLNGEDCQVEIRTTRSGTIMSSSDYPQPDNSTGCRWWNIKGQEDDIVTISFDDLDIPGEPSGNCTEGFIEVGSVVLCGSLRYMSQKKKAYIWRNSMWIKYNHVSSPTGRGFKLSYLISSPKNQTECFDMFKCDSGKCILSKWRCNGAYECTDLSDEKGCGTVTLPPTIGPYECGSGYFGCDDAAHGEYRCFPESFMCDGVQQCRNMIDEAEHCQDVQKCMHISEGPFGTLTSPNFPNDYPNNMKCSWIIHVNHGSSIQIWFSDFSLDRASSDKVEIHEVSAEGRLIDVFDGMSPPQGMVESRGNRVVLTFFSDSSGQGKGFNATFQQKGTCLQWQNECGFGERNCYEKQHKCDGVWDCPIRGGDERGCGHCGQDLFYCGSGTQCYKETDHCNGIVHCSNKWDERGCSTAKCGSHNGTFLCHNMMCIYESWRCDGTNDCGDNSDEINCPLSRKVIIAAVIGSLICALLLTIALGCTCQLHALRVREQSSRQRYRSPLTQLQDDLFARRLAPPNYNEAMVSSRSYDDAQREFLQQMENAIQSGDVDLPNLVNRVLGPARRDQNHNESQPTTPRSSECQGQGQSTGEGEQQSSDGESDTSDEPMIDISNGHNQTAQSSDSSNVLVNISLDAGVSAQWRRLRPKDHTRAIMPQRPDGESQERTVSDTSGEETNQDGGSVSSGSVMLSLSDDEITEVTNNDSLADAPTHTTTALSAVHVPMETTEMVDMATHLTRHSRSEGQSTQQDRETGDEPTTNVDAVCEPVWEPPPGTPTLNTDETESETETVFPDDGSMVVDLSDVQPLIP